MVLSSLQVDVRPCERYVPYVEEDVPYVDHYSDSFYTYFHHTEVSARPSVGRIIQGIDDGKKNPIGEKPI